MIAVIVQLSDLSPIQMAFAVLLGMFTLGWILWGFQLYRRARRSTGRDDE